MTEEKQYIRVWDLFVRASHWSFVLLILIAFLTGDAHNSIHFICGYTILGIVTLRVIWGFIGGQYARFENFIYSPAKAAEYVKGIIQGSPKHYVGHNPAAGWMVVFLLMTMILVAATGHLARTSSQGNQNAVFFAIVTSAHADDDENEDDEYYDEHDIKESEAGGLWGDIHEGATSFLLFLLVFHVAGALASSKLHNENLVLSMITGNKKKRRSQ